MWRCLELAELGRGRTAPNPLVGAVIVVNDRIIGEGYHRAAGQPHAEIEALNSVSAVDRSLLPKATLYVNLEPCSHHGRTPPCAEQLIAVKIGRVVAGMQDPNPLVAGKGFALLRKAGIAVETGVLEAACREQNGPFLVCMEKNRPWVLLKWAQSADAFLSEKSGRPVHFTSPWSDRLVHRWRADCSAILVGARTVVTDNPRLSPRLVPGYSDPGKTLSTDTGIRYKMPLRIILDQRGDLDPSARVFDGEMPTLLVRPPEHLSGRPEKHYPLSGIEMLNMPGSTVDIPELLRVLAARGISSLLVEGGHNTLQAFIQSNCWDEARIFTSDRKLGEGVPAPPPPGRLQELIREAGETLEIRRPL